ncbi:MAG: ATP-binding cassette domain-containing protein, partial [Ruminococcus sp.]|nr:ATP-binding cassette domain-containing protein [Ruminococcus sp.]
LHDVSFRINAGESVGIVGKTGSGKTTIVDLILRTYN